MNGDPPPSPLFYDGAFGTPEKSRFGGRLRHEFGESADIPGSSGPSHRSSSVHPVSRLGRKPLHDPHLPAQCRISYPRNPGLRDCLRLTELITKKSSEIKSFLLEFAQFPVPVFGMFPTGGRCQSGPPFSLTGDSRIPKLNSIVCACSIWRSRTHRPEKCEAPRPRGGASR